MFYNKLDFQNELITCMEDCRKIILNIYNRYCNNDDINLKLKEDNSPITIADRNCNNYIIKFLERLNKKLIEENSELKIGIISEENINEKHETRQNYEYVWLIDPLDGTKEFIKKNGEFTINIGLARNGIPVFGIVCSPVSDELYIGIEGDGSYYMKNCNHPRRVKINKKPDDMFEIEKPRIVASASHMSKETEDFIKKYNDCELINIGSSIKILYIAHNKADVYPRMMGTYEWDTCAAHAVIKYAGGNLYSYDTGEELTYNKENLLNPWFIGY